MPLPSVLDQLDRLFDELIHRPWGPAIRQVTPTEVREVADGWMVELQVPGMRAQDLQVQVDGRKLTVRGHRRDEQEQTRRVTGRVRTQQETVLHRTITLPAEADPEGVEANLHGATLSVHVRRRRR